MHIKSTITFTSIFFKTFQSIRKNLFNCVPVFSLLFPGNFWEGKQISHCPKKTIKCSPLEKKPPHSSSYLNLAFSCGSSCEKRPARQKTIIALVSIFQSLKIGSKKDLLENAPVLFQKVFSDDSIFPSNYPVEDAVAVFKDALHMYAQENTTKLTLTPEEEKKLKIELQKGLNKNSPPSSPKGDLHRVTESYDDLINANQKLQETSEKNKKILQNQPFITIENIILGTGDTGTTLWLEKYHAQDNKNVLMIGEDFGSWKHDYTLAQPHSLLERSHTPSNPSNYLSTEQYKSNPYANARHVYQANVVNLAKTDAPVMLGTTVKSIQKKENHKD